MRVLCLYIEHFTVAVERKERPELAGVPLVIGGEPHERKPVVDCSREAWARGVRPGLPLRDAHHLCPGAVFLPFSESRYSQAFEELLAVLDQLSPAVECCAPGKAFMDATGLALSLGSEELVAERVHAAVSRSGFRPSVSLGNSRFLAEVVAGLHEGKIVVAAPGRERDLLAPAPIELLPVSEETRRRLHLLGIRTLGQLYLLPAEALAAQFGPEGLLAHRLAGGILPPAGEGPVLPRPRPATLEGSLQFDIPLESLDGLVAAFARLLGRLLPVLRSRGQACGKVWLRLELDGALPRQDWQEWLILKAPSSAQAEILDRVRRRLERLQLTAGIAEVELVLGDIRPEPAEQAILDGGLSKAGRQAPSQSLAALGRAAKQLQARLGKPSLKKVVTLDAACRIPERRATLVDFEDSHEESHA